LAARRRAEARDRRSGGVPKRAIVDPAPTLADSAVLPALDRLGFLDIGLCKGAEGPISRILSRSRLGSPVSGDRVDHEGEGADIKDLESATSRSVAHGFVAQRSAAKPLLARIPPTRRSRKDCDGVRFGVLIGAVCKNAGPPAAG
jgi:hypothetical protein